MIRSLMVVLNESMRTIDSNVPVFYKAFWAGTKMMDPVRFMSYKYNKQGLYLLFKCFYTCQIMLTWRGRPSVETHLLLAKELTCK